VRRVSFEGPENGYGAVVTAAVDGRTVLPSFSQVLKRIFLGKPLITENLESEQLPNSVALGALSPDAISSTAYGPEQILTELLPNAGMAGFILLLPITGILLLVLALVSASYRQVVMTYTRAGGSYIVTRDNFGPRVAQIAAAALLIDYVVTVAVQSAAGTVAVASALPALGPYGLKITVGVVILISYANLRGAREAGLPFALATYSFVIMIALTIVIGVIRQVFWGLPTYDPQHTAGVVPVHQGNGLVMGATLLVLLRAYANGGSSLTGVEAISNTVNLFRQPQGANARRVLTAMACILGFLLAGVAYLAFATHASPYRDEYPSVLSQIARAVFGHGLIGNVLFVLVQVSSAAVLYVGANTSFNGFPALASFVAEDSFLPRQLMKRGHRLVYSNGIITLAVLAVILLVATGGSVNALIPLFAMGVFTGFAAAGFGMTKHHLTERERGWRRKLAINLSAGILSTIVVGIFAVAKFTEGAWLIVVIFPILVFMLMRLNREYRSEAAILEKFSTDEPGLQKYARHYVFACVNTIDIATLEALRYGKGLKPDKLVAVHFVIDEDQARHLQTLWDHFNLDTPLRMVDCPDRQVARAAQELVASERAEHPDANVTILLPRRAYGPLAQLLHDRTADQIAKAVSRTQGAAATIVPYDVHARIDEVFPNKLEQRVERRVAEIEARIWQGESPALAAYEQPDRPSTVTAIDKLAPGRSATIEGRVSEVEDVTKRGRTFRSTVVGDDSGRVRVTFRSDHAGADIVPGQLLRVTGEARRNENTEAMTIVDPAYQVVE
jgi:amino acid transporter